MSTTSETTGTAAPPTGDLVERLMDLWSIALPEDDGDALAAFGALYTDPVEINGTTMSLTDLLVRARATQASFRGLDRQIIDRVETPDRLVVAFRLLGVHAGPLATPMGVVAPTGRPVDIRVIDVLTLRGGRIAAVTMVADELANLHGLGVLRLVESS